MPEWLHRQLRKQAKKKGLTSKKDKEGLSERGKAYVYGVLQRYKKKHGG